MFTGIIQAVVRVKQAQKKNGSLFLTFEKPRDWSFKPGDSVATNGVCLTVKNVTASAYTTELMPETLLRTTFGSETPDMVNIERPLRLIDFVDGHLVQGHVDAVGKIIKIEKKGRSQVFSIQFPKKFERLVVEKGSVTLDGVSLTVAAIRGNVLQVALVDYTLAHTTFGEKEETDLVNIEFDIVGKYIQRLK